MNFLLLVLCSFILEGKSQYYYNDYEYNRNVNNRGQISQERNGFSNPQWYYSSPGNYRIIDNAAVNNVNNAQVRPIYPESHTAESYQDINKRTDLKKSTQGINLSSRFGEIDNEGKQLSNANKMSNGIVNSEQIYFRDDEEVSTFIPYVDKDEKVNIVVKIPEIKDVDVPNTNMDIRVTNVSSGIADFGINLLKNLQVVENSVVSPLSIATLLILLEQGASVQTQNQISNCLRISATPSQVAGVIKYFSDDIKERSPSSPNIIRMANNIFVSSRFNLNPEFQRTAQMNFASDVTSVDFSSAPRAAQIINKWVSDKTSKKINDIVESKSLTYDSATVLVNAVYFKGQWNLLFDSQKTSNEEFILSNGRRKTVPFMHANRYYRLGTDRETGTQAINIQFKDDEYSMMVLLPDENSDVNTVLSTLTAEKLWKYQTFGRKDTELSLPKFTIAANIDLDPVLKSMGITNIFSSQSGLSGIVASSNPIQITSAVHAATLSVDEEGSTAAAASSFGSVTLSLDQTFVFKANRPFLAIIWDKYLNVPLFMTRVEDPSI